jgi:hypothetical protein
MDPGLREHVRIVADSRTDQRSGRGAETGAPGDDSGGDRGRLLRRGDDALK